MSTGHQIVPSASRRFTPGRGPGPAGDGAARRYDRQLNRRYQARGALLFLVSFVVSSAVFLTFTYKLDYVLLKPGSARPTSAQVTVEGAPVFPPSSEINFTTVSLRTGATLIDLLGGWLDPDIDVFERERILGNLSPEENRQQNIQLMDTSKLDAVRVALIALGLEVPVLIEGAIVVATVENTNSVEAFTVGDTIVAIEGEPIDDIDDVARIMSGRSPGQAVAMDVEDASGAQTRSIEVVLSPALDDPSRGFIGVQLQPRSPRYEFPFEVSIDSGNVGGPSAGLAFSLAVIDVLTEGELTGGVSVAVTGTIDGRGNVGPIGGVQQKTVAVAEAGISVFLVPEQNEAEARKKAGDRVRIIGVGTLGEALEALRSLGGSGLALGDEVGS